MKYIVVKSACPKLYARLLNGRDIIFGASRKQAVAFNLTDAKKIARKEGATIEPSEETAK